MDVARASRPLSRGHPARAVADLACGLSCQGEQEKNSSKLNDRSGNLYENKGSLWKTQGQSANVLENKGS